MDGQTFEASESVRGPRGEVGISYDIASPSQEPRRPAGSGQRVGAKRAQPSERASTAGRNAVPYQECFTMVSQDGDGASESRAARARRKVSRHGPRCAPCAPLSCLGSGGIGQSRASGACISRKLKTAKLPPAQPLRRDWQF